MAYRYYITIILGLFLSLATHSTYADYLPCKNHYGTLFREQTTTYGPKVFLKADTLNARSFDQMTELKIGQYNVENLLRTKGKWELDPLSKKYIRKIDPIAKPESRWMQVKDVIERSDNDIMIWQEVEDSQIAKNFVEKYLGDKYRVVVIDGNDIRGIDIAVIIKKDLPLDVEVQSYRDLTQAKNGNSEKVFSRDLPIISFRKAGDPESSKPILRIAGTHYKSQRGHPSDPRSFLKRKNQVIKSLEVMDMYSRKEPNVPMLLIGDFNADLRSAPEFEPLWQAGFKDAFDLAPTPLPKEKRITQSYFPKWKRPIYSQLDAILVNKSGQKDDLVKETKIIPYLSPNGKEVALPTSFKERNNLGSDHYKVQTILNFSTLKKIWQEF
ncbi:MAG: hypothetical protein M9962_13190 [Oligoflexia bacterium]|nr:hypothetical protein [Oligoflexia bacterium]